jgi:hypothetical protein
VEGTNIERTIDGKKESEETRKNRTEGWENNGRNKIKEMEKSEEVKTESKEARTL